MKIPIQVLVYPVRHAIDGNWEYLLLKRTQSNGGFWQGVTGGVEANEELPYTARRELNEETGFVPLSLIKIDYSYSFPLSTEDTDRHLYANDVKYLKEYVFAANVEGHQEPKLSSEHEQYKWCSFDEALSLLFWPGNKEALKRCQVMLSQHQVVR